MKVLLLRPINHISVIIPNIGLGYIAAGLRRHSHDVQILDCPAQRLNFKSLDYFLSQNKFDMVGIQCYSFDLKTLRAHLSLLRKHLPSAYIVIGGAHPSALPKDMLTDYPEIDFVIVGEADESLAILADNLEKIDGGLTVPVDNLLTSVPNLAYRNNGDITINPTKFIDDLDKVSPPAWDLIKPSDYPVSPQGTFLKRYPYAPINVTRGCPFKCTFCAGYLITGRKVRSRSIDNLMEEVHLLYDEYGVRELHIEDDNFSYNSRILVDFCESVIREKLDIAWSCVNGLRIESLNKENLQLMEQAGCYSMALGIESANPRILTMMKKKITIEQVKEQVDLVKKSSNIQITGFFILGYPTETKIEMFNTVRFSMGLNIDKANFGSLMLLPGSEITDYVLKSGELEKIEWEKMTEYEVFYAPKGISRREMRTILTKAFFLFYFRPRIM
ncbi:B12-binding domain-containing radical SAM protein, partial [bacterium]|nr:B12-binding domain-containing radical SAM protein [bacterium]